MPSHTVAENEVSVILTLNAACFPKMSIRAFGIEYIVSNGLYFHLNALTGKGEKKRERGREKFTPVLLAINETSEPEGSFPPLLARMKERTFRRTAGWVLISILPCVTMRT